MRRLMVMTSLVLFVALTITPNAEAGDRKLSSVYLEVSPDHNDGQYKVGETITFNIKAWEAVPKGVGGAEKKKGAKMLPGVKLNYTIEGDGGVKKSGTVTSTDSTVQVTTKLDRPGFVLVTVQEDGLVHWQYKVVGGAGVEPEKIQPGVNLPEDFKSYWKQQYDALYSTPLKEIYREKVVKKWDNFDRYKVKLSAPGHPKNGFNPQVCGYLGIPKNAKPKSHPAMIFLPGAGTRNPGGLNNNIIQEMGFIGLAIEIHGFEADKPKDFYRTVARKGMESLPKNDGKTVEESRALNYEKTKFLRALQGLRYLKQQPEWNGKILICQGGSQGGGLSLIAGSIDPDVTAIVACYPGYNDQFGYLNNQRVGWPDMLTKRPGSIRKFGGKPQFPFAVETAPYFDGVNFARTMDPKKEVCMTAGYIDEICPATSVYAAYNSLPAGITKEFHYGVATGHGCPPDWRPIDFVKKYMKRHAAAK